LRRGFRTGEEHQGHPIACWESHEFDRRFGRAELLRASHNLIQLLLQLALIVHQRFRVTDDVDK
jgi:hypothetical protein